LSDGNGNPLTIDGPCAFAPAQSLTRTVLAKLAAGGVENRALPRRWTNPERKLGDDAAGRLRSW
jgi:hypothetical protein